MGKESDELAKPIRVSIDEAVEQDKEVGQKLAELYAKYWIEQPTGARVCSDLEAWKSEKSQISSVKMHIRPNSITGREPLLQFALLFK